MAGATRAGVGLRAGELANARARTGLTVWQGVVRLDKGMAMKSRYLVAVYALISFCLLGTLAVRPASAATMLITADTTSITAGQSVTFTITVSEPGVLNFPLFQPPGDIFFSQGQGLFDSGDGQTLPIGVGGFGGAASR
jgi:hypothetical protein